MLCNYCKKEIRDNSIICPFCGNETKRVEEVVVSETIIKSTKKLKSDDKEISVFYDRVAQLINEGKVPKSVIVDELVNQDWNPIDAEKFIKKVEYKLLKEKQFYDRVAQLLSEGEAPKSAIVDELVDQNWNLLDAEEFIKKVEYELLNKKKYQPTTERQKLAAKYKKTMLGGAITAVVGTIITIVSLNVATNSGGTYLICWGAIIFGIISLFSGLIGWLRYRK